MFEAERVSIPPPLASFCANRVDERGICRPCSLPALSHSLWMSPGWILDPIPSETVDPGAAATFHCEGMIGAWCLAARRVSTWRGGAPGSRYSGGHGRRLPVVSITPGHAAVDSSEALRLCKPVPVRIDHGNRTDGSLLGADTGHVVTTAWSRRRVPHVLEEKYVSQIQHLALRGRILPCQWGPMLLTIRYGAAA
jgi:hypothetical protein